MESLFNEYEAYTKDGNHIYDEISEAIEPIIKKWANKGYKLKDIESIAFDNVSMTSATMRMKTAIKLREERKSRG